jgi:hypothetical protein
MKNHEDDSLQVQTPNSAKALDPVQRDILRQLAAIQQKLDRIEDMVRKPDDLAPSMYDRDDHEQEND